MPTRDELVTAAVKAWRKFQGPPCTPDPAIIRPDYIAFISAMEALATNVADDRPRVFSDPDSPPPDDVTQVSDYDGDMWLRTRSNRWRWGKGDGAAQDWYDTVERWGPLTEVRQDG